MNAYPFSLIKRADRPFFLVSFKDDNGKYLPPISTKKKNEDEAKEVAFSWLRNGIPQKQNAVQVNALSLKNTVRSITNENEAATILAELKRLGWVKGFIPKNSEASEDFISFLKTFWDWDKSPYIEEKLRKKHGIHKRHCKLQSQAITLYWEKFFSKKLLGEVSTKDISNFIKHMGTFQLSAQRKNVVIKAGTKALRWAYSKSMIETDPTRGHLLFSIETHKRIILTPTIAAAIFKFEWENERAEIGNMLAAVSGIRLGEIQSLRLQDIGNDCIFVRSSWNKEDGTKTTKNNEVRKVELPFPFVIAKLIELAKKNPHGTSPDSFVFWSKKNKDKPMHGTVFLDNLRKALVKIEYTEEQANKILFHGWRHFYTSYMIRKLNKKLLKTQTGHLTDDMIDLYGDHEIDGDIELIQDAGRQVFANIIPEQFLQIEYKPKAA